MKNHGTDSLLVSGLVSRVVSGSVSIQFQEPISIWEGTDVFSEDE